METKKPETVLNPLDLNKDCLNKDSIIKDCTLKDCSESDVEKPVGSNHKCDKEAEFNDYVRRRKRKKPLNRPVSPEFSGRKKGKFNQTAGTRIPDFYCSGIQNVMQIKSLLYLALFAIELTNIFFFLLSNIKFFGETIYKCNLRYVPLYMRQMIKKDYRISLCKMNE